MKLRNKKTGEIVDLIEIVRLDDISNEFYLRLSDSGGRTFKIGFNSLAELSEEWEDASEEKKEYYCIDWTEHGGIYKTKEWDPRDEFNKVIGNYFETKEEAKKAMEKLKAWKRLKDKGFRFERWLLGGEYGNTITFSDDIDYDDETRADLNLLFGGEE